MKELLEHLFQNKTLTRNQAREVLTDIAAGNYNEAQITAFITVYCMRNISVEELQGFRDALLNLAAKVNLQADNLIDLCGTGGDGKDTFNISTLASFVVAGAGYKVAKHGNYGVSSGCGSSNVMEYLGYAFTADAGQLQYQLDSAGICFLHAPLFNPAMKTVAPIRSAMGMKTFFNMLGPMVNPAQPAFQVTGVFSLELARLYAHLYQETDKQYTILHALDGYDEISLTSDVKLYKNSGEEILTIAAMGLTKINAEAILGGHDVGSSAEIFNNVLEGKGSSAQRNVVCCNAALAIQTLKPMTGFSQCMEEATAALDSGAALNSFKKLIQSQR